MEYIEEVITETSQEWPFTGLKKKYCRSHHRQTMKHETVKNIHSCWHKFLFAFFLIFEDYFFHLYQLCQLEATACNPSLKNKGKLIYSNPKNTSSVLEGMVKIAVLH